MGEARNPDLEALMHAAARMGQKCNWGLEAVRVNTRILEEDPDNFGALYRRGQCYEKQDDFPAAKEDYSRAMRIKPGTRYVEEALERIERGWEGAEERAEKAREKARAAAARQAEKARAKVEKVQAKKRAEEARAAAEKSRAEDLRRVEAMSSFEEAYNFGVAASKGSRPDYSLAIAALKKAWELDPRKNRQGGKRGTGLFEIPTRLASIYRKNGQLDRARRTYEWVLKRDDSLYAMVGLAAVHEDCDRHSQSLELYEAVLARNPGDPYALRGLARTLSSLGQVDEAIETFYKAAEAARGSRKDFVAAVSGLERMRENLRCGGDTNRAQWIDSVLWRLHDS